MIKCLKLNREINGDGKVPFNTKVKSEDVSPND